ncbi:MAG: matrixin family metalloprotease [Labilithrix sp.]|nr:matrixin family metalloprotease [Labilithrix sp.]MBX3219306.1 matrixin family metalloprotease [Labilithrix sp.]
MKTRALPVILTSAFLVAAPRAASAFCRTTTCDPNNAEEECRRNENDCVRDGVPIKWTELPIVYRFHAEGSSKLDSAGARSAVRSAFDAWANVECARGRTSLRFREGSDIAKDKPLGKKEAAEKFGIFFRDDEWPHQDAEESLALTTQIYRKTSGTIDYADIEINTADTDFRLTDDEGSTKVDLQAVVTHEVGHYIGLAHSNDPDSIMVARYCASADRCGQSTDVARGLSEDDRRAVCTVYPPAAGSSEAPPQGCAQASSASPAGAVVIGGLVFLGCTLVRRRFGRAT